MIKNPNSEADKTDNYTSMLISNPAIKECKELVSQFVHVLGLLMHDFQSLNIDKKQTVDGTADRIV